MRNCCKNIYFVNSHSTCRGPFGWYYYFKKKKQKLNKTWIWDQSMKIYEKPKHYFLILHCIFQSNKPNNLTNKKTKSTKPNWGDKFCCKALIILSHHFPPVLSTQKEGKHNQHKQIKPYVYMNIEMADRAWSGGGQDPGARNRRWFRRPWAASRGSNSQCGARCQSRTGSQPWSAGTRRRRARPCTLRRNRWRGRLGYRPCRRRRPEGEPWEWWDWPCGMRVLGARRRGIWIRMKRALSV